MIELRISSFYKTETPYPFHTTPHFPLYLAHGYFFLFLFFN